MKHCEKCDIKLSGKNWPRSKQCRNCWKATPHDIKARFFSHVKKTSTCWLWVKPLRKDGYGEISLPGYRVQTTHRTSWELHNGKIPEGLCVLHKCDVKNCINPKHLYLGTKKDNARDAVERGQHFTPFRKNNH